MSAHRTPRRVHGFTDIGPIQIPPRPRKPALIDRVDGNTYELIISSSAPALSQITDTSGFQVFPADAGPLVADGRLTPGTRRLFSSSGTLSTEAHARVSGQAPVLITVTASPLDVWEVVWNGTALTLTEVL